MQKELMRIYLVENEDSAQLNYSLEEGFEDSLSDIQREEMLTGITNCVFDALDPDEGAIDTEKVLDIQVRLKNADEQNFNALVHWVPLGRYDEELVAEKLEGKDLEAFRGFTKDIIDRISEILASYFEVTIDDLD